MSSESELQKAIEELAAHSDLASLESMLSEFNIFEALGHVRQELRHSDFLAFLMNPAEKHGLGDRVLKRLLVKSLHGFKAPSLCSDQLDSTEINTANLSDAVVRREWEHIDILIYSQANQWVFAIENKVDSSEHSNQLARYQETVCKEFSQYRKFYIYLTKDGDKASCKAWASLSYGTVANVLESIDQSANTTNDVSVILRHYSTLIRRHLMSDSDVKALCQKIYKEHRQAIEAVYQHRLDPRVEIREFLENDLQNSKKANMEREEDCVGGWIRFAPLEWDEALAFQKNCLEWTSSRRVLLFEFNNARNYLGLNLVIGPCEIVLKRAIFDTVKSLSISGFNKKHVLRADQCSWICSWYFLQPSDYREKTLEQIKEHIRDKWEGHLKNEIATIRRAICEMEYVPADKINVSLPAEDMSRTM